MEDIDIVVVAEVTLRLSEILELLGNPRRKFKKSLGNIMNEKVWSSYLQTCIWIYKLEYRITTVNEN